VLGLTDSGTPLTFKSIALPPIPIRDLQIKRMRRFLLPPPFQRALKRLLPKPTLEQFVIERTIARRLAQWAETRSIGRHLLLP
jgi:hypothetical protein